MERRCIDTGMNTTTMPDIFSQYPHEKYDRLQKWLTTKHGGRARIGSPRN
jgi:hypothetical protein